MGPKKGKGKGGPVDGVDTTSMSREQLEAFSLRLREELDREREERNFFQLERDKLRTFWEITRQQFEETRAHLRNQDRIQDENEEKHQSEIKSSKQKVKHLLYEHQCSLSDLKVEGVVALKMAQDEYLAMESELLKDKNTLKAKLKEQELAHQEVVRQLKMEHSAEVSKLREQFSQDAAELERKYETRLATLHEEQGLQHSMELSEVEQRKNRQVVELTKSHELAFNDMKNYYNDITLNNLALISSLKEQMEELRSGHERMEKQLREVQGENKRLSEPLKQARTELSNLQRQLASYEQDKLTLVNTKQRLALVTKELEDLRWENEVLELRFDKVEKERNRLHQEFVSAVLDVQQKTGLKSAMLEKKMADLRGGPVSHAPRLSRWRPYHPKRLRPRSRKQTWPPSSLPCFTQVWSPSEHSRKSKTRPGMIRSPEFLASTLKPAPVHSSSGVSSCSCEDAPKTQSCVVIKNRCSNCVMKEVVHCPHRAHVNVIKRSSSTTTAFSTRPRCGRRCKKCRSICLDPNRSPRNISCVKELFQTSLKSNVKGSSLEELKGFLKLCEESHPSHHPEAASVIVMSIHKKNYFCDPPRKEPCKENFSSLIPHRSAETKHGSKYLPVQPALQVKSSAAQISLPTLLSKEGTYSQHKSAVPLPDTEIVDIDLTREANRDIFETDSPSLASLVPEAFRDLDDTYSQPTIVVTEVRSVAGSVRSQVEPRRELAPLFLRQSSICLEKGSYDEARSNSKDVSKKYFKTVAITRPELHTKSLSSPWSKQSAWAKAPERDTSLVRPGSGRPARADTISLHSRPKSAGAKSLEPNRGRSPGTTRKPMAQEALASPQSRHIDCLCSTASKMVSLPPIAQCPRRAESLGVQVRPNTLDTSTSVETVYKADVFEDSSQPRSSVSTQWSQDSLTASPTFMRDSQYDHRGISNASLDHTGLKPIRRSFGETSLPISSVAFAPANKVILEEEEHGSVSTSSRQFSISLPSAVTEENEDQDVAVSLQSPAEKEVCRPPSGSSSHGHPQSQKKKAGRASSRSFSVAPKIEKDVKRLKSPRAPQTMKQGYPLSGQALSPRAWHQALTSVSHLTSRPRLSIVTGSSPKKPSVIRLPPRPVADGGGRLASALLRGSSGEVRLSGADSKHLHESKSSSAVEISSCAPEPKPFPYTCDVSCEVHLPDRHEADVSSITENHALSMEVGMNTAHMSPEVRSTGTSAIDLTASVHYQRPVTVSVATSAGSVVHSSEPPGPKSSPSKTVLRDASSPAPRAASPDQYRRVSVSATKVGASNVTAPRREKEKSELSPERRSHEHIMTFLNERPLYLRDDDIEKPRDQQSAVEPRPSVVKSGSLTVNQITSSVLGKVYSSKSSLSTSSIKRPSASTPDSKTGEKNKGEDSSASRSPLNYTKDADLGGAKPVNNTGGFQVAVSRSVSSHYMPKVRTAIDSSSIVSAGGIGTGSLTKIDATKKKLEAKSVSSLDSPARSVRHRVRSSSQIECSASCETLAPRDSDEELTNQESSARRNSSLLNVDPGGVTAEQPTSEDESSSSVPTRVVKDNVSEKTAVRSVQSSFEESARSVSVRKFSSSIRSRLSLPMERSSSDNPSPLLGEVQPSAFEQDGCSEGADLSNNDVITKSSSSNEIIIGPSSRLIGKPTEEDETKFSSATKDSVREARSSSTLHAQAASSSKHSLSSTDMLNLPSARALPSVGKSFHVLPSIRTLTPDLSQSSIVTVLAAEGPDTSPHAPTDVKGAANEENQENNTSVVSDATIVGEVPEDYAPSSQDGSNRVFLQKIVATQTPSGNRSEDKSLSGESESLCERDETSESASSTTRNSSAGPDAPSDTSLSSSSSTDSQENSESGVGGFKPQKFQSKATKKKANEPSTSISMSSTSLNRRHRRSKATDNCQNVAEKSHGSLRQVDSKRSDAPAETSSFNLSTSSRMRTDVKTKSQGAKVIIKDFFRALTTGKWPIKRNVMTSTSDLKKTRRSRSAPPRVSPPPSKSGLFTKDRHAHCYNSNASATREHRKGSSGTDSDASSLPSKSMFHRHQSKSHQGSSETQRAHRHSQHSVRFDFDESDLNLSARSGQCNMSTWTDSLPSSDTDMSQTKSLPQLTRRGGLKRSARVETEKRSRCRSEGRLNQASSSSFADEVIFSRLSSKTAFERHKRCYEPRKLFPPVPVRSASRTRSGSSSPSPSRKSRSRARFKDTSKKSCESSLKKPEKERASRHRHDLSAQEMDDPCKQEGNKTKNDESAERHNNTIEKSVIWTKPGSDNVSSAQACGGGKWVMFSPTAAAHLDSNSLPNAERTSKEDEQIKSAQAHDNGIIGGRRDSDVRPPPDSHQDMSVSRNVEEKSSSLKTSVPQHENLPDGSRTEDNVKPRSSWKFSDNESSLESSVASDPNIVEEENVSSAGSSSDSVSIEVARVTSLPVVTFPSGASSPRLLRQSSKSEIIIQEISSEDICGGQGKAESTSAVVASRLSCLEEETDSDVNLDSFNVTHPVIMSRSQSDNWEALEKTLSGSHHHSKLCSRGLSPKRKSLRLVEDDTSAGVRRRTRFRSTSPELLARHTLTSAKDDVAFQPSSSEGCKESHLDKLTMPRTEYRAPKVHFSERSGISDQKSCLNDDVESVFESDFSTSVKSGSKEGKMSKQSTSLTTTKCPSPVRSIRAAPVLNRPAKILVSRAKSTASLTGIHNQPAPQDLTSPESFSNILGSSGKDVMVVELFKKREARKSEEEDEFPS